MPQRASKFASPTATLALAPVRVGVRRSARAPATASPAANENLAAQMRYCREARRLRASHANEPGALVRHLRELSRQRDRQTISRSQAVARIIGRCDDMVGDSDREFISAAEAFCRSVKESLRQQPEAFIIRYSRRLEFLREAESRGIDRFQANLIIAAAQEDVGQDKPTVRHGNAPGARRSRRWPVLLATKALMQTALAWTVWHVWNG